MKNSILYVLLLLQCYGFAQNLTGEGNNSKVATNDLAQDCSQEISQVIDENERWAALINAQCWNGLRNMYTNNAVQVTLVGDVIAGNEKVVGRYATHPIQIVKVDSIVRLTADKRQRYAYELLRLETGNGTAYKQFVIWNNSENKREFEFTAPSMEGKLPTLQLNKRRKRWMELCNSHNTTALVKELYTENAIYYNHRPVVTGWEGIIKEYAYMNNPNYQLTLTPIIVERVSENLIY
jgi:hypothetical protein